jgi:ATP-dependent DNA helicase RecQ
MAAAGFISQGMLLTAFVRPRGANSSRKVFETMCGLEQTMLDFMRELAPDAAPLRQAQGTASTSSGSAAWQDLSLRQLNQGLLDQGQADSNPQLLRTLLNRLRQDGRGFSGRQGSLFLQYVAQDFYKVRLQRDWPALIRLSDLRRAVAKVVLDTLLAKTTGEGEILLAFSADELIAALKNDTSLAGQIQDHLAALEHGLLFLHETRAISLQQGLAVFRQAMSIRIFPESKGRRYTKGDYEPLGHHYHERIVQVHVMNEYARLALHKISEALNLVAAYFMLERKAFLSKFFGNRKEMLERATSAESYRRIVESLNNPAQTAIVVAPEEGNPSTGSGHCALVLAGPGSGKTRVVVHRCAYLLRVKRVPARAILVLCFNRHAAISLRKRLAALVGFDAHGVTVQTYHGLALRLSGVSLAERRREALDFDQLIRDATALLRGEKAVPGWEADELRERLLAGYRHILVDEYQDIDPSQYDLISAIAGRTERDPEAKLSLLAVGDDDQNIYGFRGADVRFIRQFQHDYQAQVYYLLDNYRSTRHIVEVSNSLIAHNRERMKLEYPIRVNPARATEPPGGRWQNLDPLAQGRVQVLDVADAFQQAEAVVAELRRLRELDSDFCWGDCALLAFQWDTLMPLRALCEHHHIPLFWAQDSDSLPALTRIREIAVFLDALRERVGETLNAAQLAALIPGPENPFDTLRASTWTKLLGEVLDAWREEAGEGAAPTGQILEFCYDLLREYRHDPQSQNAVFCATLHRAKGLEFKHVLVLDGPWGRGEAEENRRLFYVAMTRARENLILCQRFDSAQHKRSDQHNPHIPLLEGELCHRTSVAGTTAPHEILARRFEVLGLKDFFLDYAGRQPPESRAALAALQPGSALFPKQPGELADAAGVTVALLSQAARQTWAERWQRIESITVLALARRDAEDSDPKYREKLRCTHWEVPVVEVIYR